MAASSQRASVIVPVRDDSALLRGCLDAVRAQGEQVDEVIVVDDSPRGTLDEVDGVRVLRSGGKGPYAARNVGWRAADSEVLLFVDVRSRPRPNWGRVLTGRFQDPSVALAGSNVLTRGGTTLGARLGERQQFYELRKYTTDAWFRPYVPTCNLAARRTDLEAIGGFREIRSGADADLCWRTLERPGRRLETIPETLMEWVPRATLRGYLEQNYRYGRSHRALRQDWAAQGAPTPVGMSYPLLARRIAGVVVRSGLAAARRRDEELLEQLLRGGRFAYHVGYRRAAGG